MTYRSRVKKDLRLVLRQRKAVDWLLSWAYRDTAFERLNPEE